MYNALVDAIIDTAIHEHTLNHGHSLKEGERFVETEELESQASSIAIHVIELAYRSTFKDGKFIKGEKTHERHFKLQQED